MRAPSRRAHPARRARPSGVAAHHELSASPERPVMHSSRSIYNRHPSANGEPRPRHRPPAVHGLVSPIRAPAVVTAPRSAFQNAISAFFECAMTCVPKARHRKSERFPRVRARQRESRHSARRRARALRTGKGGWRWLRRGRWSCTRSGATSSRRRRWRRGCAAVGAGLGARVGGSALVDGRALAACDARGGVQGPWRAGGRCAHAEGSARRVPPRGSAVPP